ncbi:hypothetical protein AMTR_s00039p00095670 [Amborella trichopoda]|uniref:Uncharacterized protein n=1 Tax=Amborella trichopoda TaxID=13333 RepID=U5CRC5_AMBTC|nr:hypothetical protein AMTR_s00039p00095670 [Amborella trichopoda]
MGFSFQCSQKPSLSSLSSLPRKPEALFSACCSPFQLVEEALSPASCSPFQLAKEALSPASCSSFQCATKARRSPKTCRIDIFSYSSSSSLRKMP